MLLDFSLPDSVGLDSYWALRDRHPEVPVIILTSLDDDNLALRAVAEGAQDYLVKRQVDAPLLARAIRYAIERHRSELALRESEQRYALAMQGANDGIWDWDLRAGQRLSLAALAGDGGHRRGRARHGRAESWFACVARRTTCERLQRAPSTATCRRRRTSTSPWSTACAAATARSSGCRPAASRCATATGRVIRMAGSMTDITARKRAEEQLVHDAFHDGLTAPRQPQSLPRSPRHGARPRRSAATRGPSPCCSSTSTASRRSTTASATRSATSCWWRSRERLEKLMRPGRHRGPARRRRVRRPRLRRPRGLRRGPHRRARPRALVEPFTIDRQEVFITASIGIALGSTTCGAAPRTRCATPTLAMYRAKAAGRGATRCSTSSDAPQRRVQLLQARDRAAPRRSSAATSSCTTSRSSRSPAARIVGFEAPGPLAPSRARPGPAGAASSPLAEETGLIVPHRLAGARPRPAARSASGSERFPTDPPYFVSVNVSGKLFAQERHGRAGAATSSRTSGLPPERRCASRSPRASLMDHGERGHAPTSATCCATRRAAVASTTSAPATRRSPTCSASATTTLKIDRSFVSDIAGADSLAIVETILSLASHLGIGVVAEGIETAEQLAHLRSLGCPHGQGYWFAKPLAPGGGRGAPRLERPLVARTLERARDRDARRPVTAPFADVPPCVSANPGPWPSSARSGRRAGAAR